MTSSTIVLDDGRIIDDSKAEREEILRHKWFLSEQAHIDVGFEKALLDWVIYHRNLWRAARKKLLSA